MAFSTQTWDGWDYIPHAWPVWLTAADGVLLVALGDGGRPVAVSRVALVSATEGWVEGIRVDPAVRGTGVATDLQVAELHWLAAHAPRVTRYATGARNEGSHRLGARHGFELLSRFQTWRWQDPADPDGSNRREQSGFDEATRLEANRRRRELLGRLQADGLVLEPQAAGEWWSRLDADAGIAAGNRLYERRSWAMQELTSELFGRHCAAGEVVGLEHEGGWALAIITAEIEPAEDAGLHLAAIAGDNGALAALARSVQLAAKEVIRFRLAAGHVGTELAAALGASGFDAWPWELHILARSGDEPVPDVDPARLVLADQPRRVIEAPG